jgi:hypothetical protein
MLLQHQDLNPFVERRKIAGSTATQITRNVGLCCEGCCGRAVVAAQRHNWYTRSDALPARADHSSLTERGSIR